MLLQHTNLFLQDGMLDKQSAGSFRRVFAPKLAALDSLAAASHCQPLASLVLFSSVASLLGAPGQGNYAAANAALDAWADSRQAAGGAARSVQWGAWASSGMASEAVLRRLARIGQGMITAAQGLLALGITLRAAGAAAAAPALPQLVVNGFIWDTYLQSSHSPFFSEFAPGEKVLVQGSSIVPAGGRRRKQAAAAGTPAALDPAAARPQVYREVTAAIVQACRSSRPPLLGIGAAAAAAPDT